MQFVYSLINFLILAAILFVFGRKTVLNLFRSRRERIDAALTRAEQIENEPAEIPELPDSFSDALPRSVTEEIAGIRRSAEEAIQTAGEVRLETELGLPVKYSMTREKDSSMS